jgi:hypothetical protein
MCAVGRSCANPQNFYSRFPYVTYVKVRGRLSYYGASVWHQVKLFSAYESTNGIGLLVRHATSHSRGKGIVLTFSLVIERTVRHNVRRLPDPQLSTLRAVAMV